MLNNNIFHRNLCASIFIVLLFVSNKIAICGDSSGLNDIVFSRLSLINQIVNDPKAANMKNWTILGNPNDESELKFYMNSISNGTSSSYHKAKESMGKVIEHSKSTSEDEPSVLLQHLRLSLMAYSIRPGSAPPFFELTNLSQPTQNEVIAKCIFRFTNASGSTANGEAQVFFDIGDNPRSDVYLRKIIINGRVTYGGW